MFSQLSTIRIRAALTTLMGIIRTTITVITIHMGTMVIIIITAIHTVIGDR